MHFDESDYEDELDRMKVRKQRRKTRNSEPIQAVEEDDSFQFYDDVEDLEFEQEPEEVIPHRSSGKRKRRKRRPWKLILAFIVLLCGYFLVQRIRDDGYWTVAVFGVDSRDGNLGKGALADVDMVCSINKKTGEIRLVSVFRDTYLKIDNQDSYHKINEAYFKGGHKQAVDALEQNLDIKIDDYATFNWKAVVDAINVLGGVDVDITEKEFAYINGFITETVNSTGVGSYQLEHSGMNHLDGVQAVAYSRLRLMDTDFNRTERQRKILSLAMEKAKSADFNTLKTLVGTVFPQVSTSIGVDDLLGMAKNARKYYIGQTSGFPFSHTEMKVGKMDCVIPTTLESNVIQLHQVLYEDDHYTPSSMVKKISNQIAEKTGLGEPGTDIESNRNPGGNSGGGGEKKPSATNPAPQETAPPETESVPETESTEETSESESIEETTIAPMESTGENSEESTSPVITAPEETTAKPTPTMPAETPPPKETTGGALEGPGQSGDGATTEAAGPGAF